MEVMLLSCFAAINSTLRDCALFLYSSPKARRPLIHFASSILKSLKEWAVAEGVRASRGTAGVEEGGVGEEEDEGDERKGRWQEAEFIWST